MPKDMNDTTAPGASIREAAARMWPLARAEWRCLLAGTSFLVVGSSMVLLYPQAVRVMVDEALDGGLSGINRAAFAMVGIFTAQAFAVGLRYYLFTVAGERIVTRLRETLYRRLIHREIGFFDRRRTGELMSRLSSDTTVLQNTVTVNLSMALRNLLVVLGGVAMMAFSSPPLTFVMLGIVPPVALGAAVSGRWVSKLSKKSQDALAAAGEVAEETIAGIRTVRSFVRENRECERYGAAVWRSFDLARRRVQIVAVFVACMIASAYGTVAAVLWFGGRRVVNGELSVGELSAFILYTLFVATSLSSLGDLWGDFMKARGASERVFDLLETDVRAEGRGVVPMERAAGRVELQGVSFAYPTRPDIAVLRSVDLVLEPGQVVALVGPSGAGKSTVAALIPRLYELTSGRILLDGVDIATVDAHWLRHQIASVAQEPLLFSTSIGDNIRYGRDRASNAEVEAAARAANAHDFITAMPEGYETEVGERGVQLSGGQKQRVAIARALLKDPPVLILDEATSALDAESEALVQEALERLMQHRTSLVIAHRLSTVRDAAQVVVLDGGRVVQIGPHDQLIAEEGVYRRLVEHQLAPAVSLI